MSHRLYISHYLGRACKCDRRVLVADSAGSIFHDENRRNFGRVRYDGETVDTYVKNKGSRLVAMWFGPRCW